MTRPQGLRTWIEVDREALKHNYRVFRGLISPTTKLMAVVKSNAYGHNLVEFSRELQKLGVDWFGVDSIVEARALRRVGIKKSILVLGYTLPEKLAAAARQNISLTVSHRQHLEAIAKLKEPRPKIHLKIDTGLHRQGFSPAELVDIIKYIEENLSFDLLEGVYTHFATAKDTQQPKTTVAQVTKFNKVLGTLAAKGPKPLRHAAATGAAIIFPRYHYDLIRLGLGLYGHYPSKEIEKDYAPKLQLKPALSWKVVVGEVKKVPKGERVGYDLTEKLKRDSRLAVCPVGYWHGYPRTLSSRGRVLIDGKSCKILGRISMDMIVIDATEAPNLKVGDEVVLIGRQGEQEITAEDLAKLSRTTSYEILTRLNPLIKRIYI